MNLSLILKEERYQKTIYLNDRPYDVLDVGEGGCQVMIVSSINQYMEVNRNNHINERVIVIDISKVINEYGELSEPIENFLVNDLHLLFDVWLEEVEIKSDVGCINMTPIYKVVEKRNHSQLLLK
ncbi:hypothetical protein [Vibrio europaeus]|uniref:hypothetical protein n=1 Tax=Vibrio europaeus TaxID=300876 RepID=UPI00233F645A|nr:hypothetical protein [Vibrio europaeus]MDC5813388.1 hypothetical protein [Vibrio europaeus]